MFSIVWSSRLRKLEMTAYTIAAEFVSVKQQLVAAQELQCRAEQDAQYWKARAELFIDQIGLRSGTLTTPTMTPPPAASGPDEMQTVFASLGKSEIHSKTSPAAPAAVTGVNEAAATAAIDDLLSTVSRTV